MNRNKDFSEIPIIILGANHSGTRMVVEILEKLGSDAGLSNNIWRENELFLKIHKELVEKITGKPWGQVIFNLSFIKNFRDEGQYADFMKEKIKSEIKNYYHNFPFSPWHWKCPTSLLFIKSWLRVYPNAYYVHIFRDPYSVAESLLLRRQFLNPFSALRFTYLMNSKINNVKITNYLRVNYESIEHEINKLINFLPFSVDLNSIDKALSIIKRKQKKIYNLQYSFRKNLWIIIVNMILSILRLAEKICKIKN